MPCMNAKALILVIFAWLPLLAQAPAAREYEAVKRPEFHLPERKRPAPPAPAKTSIQTRQAKIPSFAKTEPEETAETPGDATPASSPVRLFGTVEFRRPLDTLPGWLDVLARNSREPVFQPDRKLLKGQRWQELKSSAQDLPIMEKLRLVNKFWNQSPYREDMENWGREDYWAIPGQFIKKSGDCEDYAIAKYFTLKELGVDPHSMRIVVLRDTIRNLAHAVLAVYVNGDAYILDNVTNIVLSHKRIRNYQPQFSVNESGRWSHIKGKAAK